MNGNIPGSASNHQNTSQQHIQTNGHYNTTPSSTHSMNNTGQPLNPNDPKFEVIIISWNYSNYLRGQFQMAECKKIV